MQVTDKGQVTIPKHIRTAAGVTPGTEVEFSLEGSRIVMTPVASPVRDDRRTVMRKAAAKVRASLPAEFRQLGADDIMAFLRSGESSGREPARSTRARRGGRG
jgi:AbrB family looped-hinge helix DNA binding protein